MALVNQIAIPRKMQLSSLALILLLSGTVNGALADQTDPDFVPPEITLPMPARYNPPVTPTASSPNLGNTPAPGMTNMGANMGAGAIPGMNNPNQPNPFMMKAADRLRLPPGTSVPGRGSGPPGAAGANPGYPGYPGQQMAAPPQGSSAFLQPGQQPPGAATPLQKQLAAQGQNQGNQNNQGGQTDPVVTLQTNKGTIVMRLFRQHAPITVKAFLQMVKSGFYNGLTFHRVEPGFVVQGGCPNGNGTGDYIPPGQTQPRYLPLEVSPFARHNAAGVVAMARKPNNRDSSSCQFYITLGPKQQLDNQYTVFGGVIQGLDVVQRIAIGDRILAMTASE